MVKDYSDFFEKEREEKSNSPGKEKKSEKTNFFKILAGKWRMASKKDRIEIIVLAVTIIAIIIVLAMGIISGSETPFENLSAPPAE